MKAGIFWGKYMRNRALSFIALMNVVIISSCSQSLTYTPSTSGLSGFSGNGSASGGTVSSAQVAGSNVMSISVNGSGCGTSTSTEYPNEPCVSVTICSPSDPSNCQTIGSILLDTGSFGLRLFQSVITVPLTQVSASGGGLAECIQYGDGSSQWGPVETALVHLGNEPAVQVPIQVIDASYSTPPAPCSSSQSTPDTSPAQAGFNGILGVGLFAQDCGAVCADSANNNEYYTCSGSSCSGAVVALANQVPNPVSVLPSDNNGVILELPSVGPNGASSVSGNLVLGIGTQANNQPSGVTAYAADQTGEFTTVFSAYSSTAMGSFIDSGSSALFFPQISSTPDCGNGWDCPTSVLTLTATNISASGSPSGTVTFQVGNAETLFNSGNMVFSDNAAGGLIDGEATFDWGLPFFFGRNVYVGIDGTASGLGTGPYWAY
jgi:hypothetical protein